MICVGYVYDCLFWALSQSEIDHVIKFFKEDGTSYNLGRSKGKSVSGLLVIDIKTLDYGGFQFCKTGLIPKVLEATGMDRCNGLPTPTKVEAPLGKDANGSEAKIDWTN